MYTTKVPEILKSFYNQRQRIDGKPGYLRVVPTSQRFIEGDGTDVRLSRVYVYNTKSRENILRRYDV